MLWLSKFTWVLLAGLLVVQLFARTSGQLQPSLIDNWLMNDRSAT